jgi:DNA-binding transcriptional ArsR family regulator
MLSRLTIDVKHVGSAAGAEAAMLYRSVKYKQNSLDAVFAALADPTRRAIAERLAEGPASMTELAEPFDVTLPAIVKQLAVLEHAGLVAHKKDGRVRYFTLVPGRLDSVAQWLEHRASSGASASTGCTAICAPTASAAHERCPRERPDRRRL